MSEDPKDQDYTEELVNRYEQMMADGASYYFDAEELEEIIAFYCEDARFKKALKVVDYAYTLFPDNTTILLREGQILTALGQLNKALARLRLLEKSEPNNEEMLLTMSGIYSQLREHQKSIDLLKRALNVVNKEFEMDIYLEIALEYENLERFDKAIEILQEALLRNPENETLLYELAYCFEMNERLAESLEYYEQFIENHPFSFPAWYNKANALQRLEQFDEALEAYEFCLAIQPDFTPAYFNKAHTYFKMGRYQEAIQTFEETYAYEQPQAPLYCHMGECFEKMGELDKALFYYRKSLNTDELFADAHLGIGLVMDMQGKTIEGMQYIERAIELEPENPDYHLFMVELLKKLDRWSEAEAITEALISRFPDNEDVWLEHSDHFFEHADFEKALHFLEEGWKRCPSSSEISYRRVAYLHGAGRIQEAADQLFRAFKMDTSGMEDLAEYYPEIKEFPFFIELLKQRELLKGSGKK